MKKEIGFIGLGRMGFNMATRLVESGYRVVTVYRSDKSTAAANSIGVEVVADYQELVNTLSPERVIWMMVPSGEVDNVLAQFSPLVAKGDTIIDGGNTFFKETLRRYQDLNSKGINYIDCGVSGGITGARNGASVMVGGNQEVFNRHEEIFKTLATPNGYARVGNTGAGHFVKMIHNAIEYGMMGAIAEGFNVLSEKQAEFGLDIKQILKPYQNESIIAGKLVDWLATAYTEGQIDAIVGEVPKGETEFEMEYVTTISNVKILEQAIEQRKATRINPSYTGKLIAAMRNQFGGHKVITPEDKV
jgi:6-phosphogluconate dehydrogenase